MRLLRLLPLMSSTNNKIIQNMDLPSCKNCIHFKPPLHDDSMHGKFSIIYDALSNHYKNHYKTMYEEDAHEI